VKRLQRRVRGMHKSGQHDQAAAAQSAAAPAPGSIYANGTASPGGTPQTAPRAAPGTEATGLLPVTAGTGASQGAVAATGRGGLSVASPPGPMTTPLQAVLVTPTDSQYVTIGAEEMQPIYTPDGAAIPATTAGHWAQLRAAGRP
jgi:hypothetical protein